MRGWWVCVGLLAGCGGPDPGGGGVPDAGVDASADAAPPAVEARCAPGSMGNAAGECVTVGVRACADRWRDAEGRCRPRVEDCLPDGIPNLATGECAPVGLPACPDVFREADGRCRPSASKCPEGTTPVPSMGCVSLDELAGGCGEAPFGPLPDEPGNRYVDPRAPDGGDGTRARPFRTIAEALGADDRPAHVILAAGEYREPIALRDGQHLVGRCPSMVRLVGDHTPFRGTSTAIDGSSADPTRYAVVAADGADMRVARLTIASGKPIRAHAADVGVHLVRTEGTQRVVTATGAIVRAEWLDVGPPAPGGASDEHPRSALWAGSGSALDLDHCSVRGLAYPAIGLDHGLADVRDCLFEGNGWMHHPDVPAVSVGEGSQALLVGNAIVGNRYGVRVDRGGHLALRRNLVADSVGDGLGLADGDAFGLVARFGAQVDLAGNAFVGNGPAAVRAESEGTVVESRGNLFAGADGFGARAGVGVELLGRARMVSREDVFAGNSIAGVRIASDEGPVTGLDMAGAVIAGTRSDARGRGGRGVDIRSGADVAMRDSVVLDNRDVGVSATLPSRLLAEHCEIAGTAPRGGPEPRLGIGVAVQFGATATLRHCRVEDNHVAGVFVAGGGPQTRADFEDGLVGGTLPGRFVDVRNETHDGPAYAFVATRGATLCARRSVARPGGDVALLYDASDGCVEATDARALPVGLSIQGSPRPAFTPGDPLLGVVENGRDLPTPDVETSLP